MVDRADWEDVDGVAVDDSAPLAETDALVGWSTSEDVVDDDPLANVFTEEIENVAASDWDIDADVLWGEDSSLDIGMDPGAGAYDFPA